MNSPKTEYYFSGLVIIPIELMLIIASGTFVYFVYIMFMGCMYIPVAICLLSLCLFSPALLKFFKYIFSLLKSVPALILTDDKLIDNINNQTYKWADIKAIVQASSETSNDANGYITISLVEPDKFINACKNPYQRFTLSISERYFRNAFSIQPSIIKCNKCELLYTLKAYHHQAITDNTNNL